MGSVILSEHSNESDTSVGTALHENNAAIALQGQYCRHSIAGIVPKGWCCRDVLLVLLEALILYTE